MDPPTRDILTNPPAFPPSPATTTLFTNPPTTPIQTIQTWETPDRILTGIHITWTNGDSARLGVCSDASGPGIGIGAESRTDVEMITTIDHNNNSNCDKSNKDNKATDTDTNPTTPTLTPTTTPPNNLNPNTNKPPIIKTFTFDRQERIQIMYVYVSSTQVDGFWFVTNKQKSFFPGRSSERREMSDLGSGVLVGIEGREKRDEDQVVGILGLGVSFRR
ncbi:uncharacterized protein KD926_010464 [Aspergillus affinis]|uniref:uncharacterized protein n=1 Tax=Aspergillus affinis TaxID=1070780 RepID=UPI0022FDC085|nr:uncharacterized protein KD926_010464 [Aspergillus affinis]KAI9038729.1 hypothetical protein KD926_010464 [Aspergillus affinis]